MMINWKVRFRNKSFLVALFAALLFFVQQVAAAAGIDITTYSEQATNIFNALLTVLLILGVIVDPTTQGVRDSEQAMTYGKETEAAEEEEH